MSTVQLFTDDDVDNVADVGVSCLHKVISAKVMLVLHFHFLIWKSFWSYIGKV